MRKSLRLLVLFALLLTATATPIQADYWKGEVYYYSDACYTNVIGYFVRYCDNSTSSWGQQSAWSTESPFNCDRPPLE
ncbi:MAG TPA: DUF6289 family protein [Thermoanaerobaculia bacterium]|nr:DUF6289 family protein [Thermoanaerobaculia bacterium]